MTAVALSYLGSAASLDGLVARPSAPGPASPIPFEAFQRHTHPRPSRTLELEDVRTVLDEGRFWTEYQAIVHAGTGNTVAFEALARFRHRSGRPLPPDRVFPLLRSDPALLLRAELTLKLHQIEHAPRGTVFVNLDPHAWARAGDGQQNPFLALFSTAGGKVVVEVTEAFARAEALAARHMLAAFRARDLTVALDDVGAVDGLVSFEAMAEAEVLKFDRAIVPRLQHPRYRALVQALTRMARETGARTVLEGVETTAEFVTARDLGFDLVQGFLFKDRARVAN
jgi:EAL domain-containing protein (putative c-di-GMP-specific phosphodiesterase class I)